jgi:hypothetical protein
MMKWQESSLTTIVNELLSLDEVTLGEAKKLNAIKKSLNTPPAYPITAYDAQELIALGHRYLTKREEKAMKEKEFANQGRK